MAARVLPAPRRLVPSSVTASPGGAERGQEGDGAEKIRNQTVQSDWLGQIFSQKKKRGACKGLKNNLAFEIGW